MLQRFPRAVCFALLGSTLLIRGVGNADDSPAKPAGKPDVVTKAKPSNQPTKSTDNKDSKSADAKHPEKVTKTAAQWRKQLTPLQYKVARLKDTEPAFTGAYWNSAKTGIYHCVCCDQPLFDSKTKFNSGTGWPSYWQPVGEVLKTKQDISDGTPRVEVVCKRCDAHLGHVFGDGPAPSGLRYCINSASLKFEEKGTDKPADK